MGSGNKYTLFAIATTAAGSLPARGGAWTLQHRRPEGSHWVVIGHFPAKKLAQETVNAFVTAGYGTADDVRVKREKENVD